MQLNLDPSAGTVSVGLAMLMGVFPLVLTKLN